MAADQFKIVDSGFVITIRTDNDAFEEHGYCQETARILRALASKMDDLCWEYAREACPIRLLDSNGNIVGECQMIEK